MDQCTPETIVVEEEKEKASETIHYEHPYDGWLPQFHFPTSESATDDLDH